ncbi:MAG: hypothetical protein LBO65_04600 [Spirochaetaceae bacterium]|nr:hypothetical protein [Spirochaetaceae bacterium]
MKNLPLKLYLLPGLLTLLIWGGCSNTTAPTRTTDITINNPPGAGPFFSLTVYDGSADIIPGSSLTGLGGYIAQGVAAGNAASVTIGVGPEITSGNYMLVLGVSPDMSGTGGKLYITGTGGNKGTIAVTVGTPITYSASTWLNNGGNGYERDGTGGIIESF